MGKHINKSIFLYFYSTSKLSKIKNQNSNKLPEGEKRDRSLFSTILRNIGVAALTTLCVYTTILFLNVGTKMFTLKLFSAINLYEILFAFLFLLVLFWIHRKISGFVNSPGFKKMTPVKRSASEAVLVVICTIVALSLVNFLPIIIVYPNLDPPEKNLRIAYVVSIIISLFFYYYVERDRNRKQLQAEMLRTARLQKENYQAQLKSLKDQVQPHFLFNSLNVLSSLIHKDANKALEFTGRLSDLYRSFLDHGQESLIPLKRELEISRDYCYLLETRFGKAVKFSFKIPENSYEYQVPPGSLQLLIENAIKHNGSTTARPLEIDICLEDEHLIVSNKLRPRKERTTSGGTGLKNIERRYKYLTDKKPEFRKTEERFIAKLPLLKVEDYENSDH